jgi:transaldolase
VTLIFSLERYGEVIDAHMAGLEQAAANGHDISQLWSVASFFVSRVDTEVDRRLEKAGADPALAGRAAVAQAKMAYELFQSRFSGPRWDALARAGAHVQRPLWASTSTKNPAYPDLLYVDNLIGPDTVNTMPDSTVEAFVDHGTVARTVDQDVAGARHLLEEELPEAGIDMASVSQTLEQEGVSTFVKSYDELIQSLSDKANAIAG